MYGCGGCGVSLVIAKMDLMAKLRAFEAEHARGGVKCAACRLPEHLRAFLVDGRKAGGRYRSLAAVLAAEGHTLSAACVGHHLREHAKQG